MEKGFAALLKVLQEYSTLVYGGSHGFAHSPIEGMLRLIDRKAMQRYSLEGEERSLAPDGKREDASLRKQNLHNLKITFGHFIRDGKQGLR